MLKKIVLLSLVLVASMLASSIEVKNSYIREIPPSIPNSALFLTIVNHTSKNVSLLEVKSNIAKNIELHTHEMKNHVMKMYQVDKIDIKALSKTILKPGSFHIMLLGLNKKLKVGKSFDFELIFSNGAKVSINAPVKKVMKGMQHVGMKKMKMQEHGMKKMKIKTH